MKKVLFILFNLLTITAMSQTKGRFEVHDLGHFKLHVYYTNDVLGDASYIVEGKDALGLQPCPYGRDLYRLVRPGNFCNTPAFFLFSSNEIFLRILLIYKNYSYLCPHKSVV